MHCLGSQRHPTGCLTTKPLPKKGPWASGNLRDFGGHWYAKTLELPLLKTVVIRFRYHLCLEKYATRWSVLSTESSLKSKTRESVNNWQKNTLPKTYINPKLMVGYMFLRLLLEQCSFSHFNFWGVYDRVTWSGEIMDMARMHSKGKLTPLHHEFWTASRHFPKVGIWSSPTLKGRVIVLSIQNHGVIGLGSSGITSWLFHEINATILDIF